MLLTKINKLRGVEVDGLAILLPSSSGHVKVGPTNSNYLCHSYYLPNLYTSHIYVCLIFKSQEGYASHSHDILFMEETFLLN